MVLIPFIPVLTFASGGDQCILLAGTKSIRLVVFVEKDEVLLNFISLIPTNQVKFPKRNKDAMTFVSWLIAPDKGKLIVRDFGEDK